MSAAPSRQSQPPRATLADFFAIPEDKRFHELIDGELIPKATPSYEHGDAQGSVIQVLRPFKRRPGGRMPGGWWFATEVEIRLGPDVYRPDVVGWRRERVPERPKGNPVTIRPDWICEVISPGNASNDTVRKMRAYHQAEVPHYWLIDPLNETLTVQRWGPDGYVHVLGARRQDRVRAEPFEATVLQVGVLFGDDEDDNG